MREMQSVNGNFYVILVYLEKSKSKQMVAKAETFIADFNYEILPWLGGML